MPRISSTSFITGTGFMKCMPMKRSGRSVAAARRVIEMDEVLVARMARRAAERRRDRRRLLRFTAWFSADRLDGEVHVGELIERQRGLDLIDRPFSIHLGDAAGCDLAGEVAVDGRKARLDAFLAHIVEGDGVAGERTDMGDAVAHLAGSNYPDLRHCLSHLALCRFPRGPSISQVREKRKPEARFAAVSQLRPACTESQCGVAPQGPQPWNSLRSIRAPRSR